MYKVIRFILFQFDPERIHYFSMNSMRIVYYLFPFNFILRKSLEINSEKLEVDFFGKKIKNPVGLAAGFDKDGRYIKELELCGFGFVEIGTVTCKSQSGNPKPRLFRLKKDEAIINRMGFNNQGVEEIVKNLKKYNGKMIIGGNIGKNKITPNEIAVNDYLESFNTLFDYVDYFVVNVSSPNTPNLRELQDKEPLTKILKAVRDENLRKHNPKPIFLKIAPDLNNTQLDEIIDIILDLKIHGIIATNTTIDRTNLKTDISKIDEIGNGGLSGKPLSSRSTEIIKYISKKSNKSFMIIGVGGIHSEEDAIDKLEAGADLVQLYTGFIYEGPSLIKRINKAIIRNHGK